MLRFLEDINLYLKPETFIVLLGKPEIDIARILNHTALRNTAQALYAAVPDYNHENQRDPFSVKPTTTELTSGLQPINCSGNNESKSCGMSGYSFGEIVFNWRCLYCTAGYAGVKVIDAWDLQQGFNKEANLFPYQFRNFHGHKFHIVSMEWFPILNFSRNTDEPATTVTPTDSLDYRMLTAVSSILNFTYEMRTPIDNQWGISMKNGSWTGTVGTLQRHEADFSMLLSWMATRMDAVDYSRIYISESLLIVTLKPGPLPQIFSIFRPFPGELWVAIVIASSVAGVVLWLLQKLWNKIFKGKILRLSTAMLYSWGILLDDPPMNSSLPTNVTFQVIIGFWWVFCILITTAYRSSLIAYLSVPEKSSTIDTLEQLLGTSGFTWGMEETYGIEWEWFKESTIPTVQKVYERILPLTPEEQLARVLKGHHAFLTWKYYIKAIILSSYTDSRGYTPLHTGRAEYINYGGYGWGFRKGAPFRRRIDEVKLRLIESGLIQYWIDDLILTSSIQARKNNRKNWSLPKVEEGNGGRVVLSLLHLQGVFYLLALGFILAFLILMMEILTANRKRKFHQ
ncbi:probable glutamate receptor [Palaemon carinicauda]|uniref:probable glutamate receptor n=1 Tax=Palaemon carinicauda TaxID=392227 RepID=UPI0035B5E960